MNYNEYQRNYQKTEKYKAWRREYRKKIKNIDSKKYEKTENGFLMRAYRNMKSRVSGIQKLKAHLYSGKSILEKELFYKWSKTNKTFIKLFKDWQSKNYDRKLTPSVNRINSEKGYDLDNMEWITHSENSRLVKRKMI